MGIFTHFMCQLFPQILTTSINVPALPTARTKKCLRLHFVVLSVLSSPSSFQFEDPSRYIPHEDKTPSLDL
ncbi:unnamed protein product [Zymoseptoria tritici ST99CH_1E4]|uniref:Uncharacterized protein n=1 Tax=Zymoseptoria tritici ST99CH_1E4 TaxID=1276532 RepID=A0A2H1FWX4_ZYMTR|nr:unnamed protein product [Zymoseptoria tritici ST99CH_1E4]